ncbi:unnamed protein product [Paramecium pentaurelia]|uniref:COP9 signalosome complex subunit 3 N-terminal helical repeats domain-containing protein n=1 Tax=Paramecium pentaurelia TaxID=43138 RepID=A0A8S1VVL3_9CILI|nr:unnamed protein product [Paramecium pentaurelia]
MYLEKDEYDIPNEQQIYASFQSDSDQLKLQYLASSQSEYENKHIVFLSKYFLEIDFKKISIQTINIQAICLSKFTQEQKTHNPNIITKILNHIKKQLQQQNFLNELHIAFLESCIMSYNYKIGYQFIKSKIFLKGSLEKKSQIIIEYFYLSGLIANAQKDFDEAFRCYKIAHKFHPTDVFTIEAQKMESLLCFRLGLELRNWSHPTNQLLVTNLQSILQEKEYILIKESNLDIQDKDINICLKEWSLQAQLYQFLKNEQELHSKVTFNLINNHFKIQDYEYLIDLLLQINKIHNMFLINEEKHYIEFNYNNLNYKEINSKLENRFDLLKSLNNTK